MHDLHFCSNTALAQTKDEKVRKVIMRSRYTKSVSASSSSSTTGLGAGLDTGLKLRGGLLGGLAAFDLAAALTRREARR